MKLYAVRDRLIDYFKAPFAAPSDKEVLAGIAKQSTEGTLPSEVQAAPHHFEIWRIADITEDGHVTQSREFLADVSSLIRTSVRENRADRPAATPPHATAGTRQGTTGSPMGPRGNVPDQVAREESSRSQSTGSKEHQGTPRSPEAADDPDDE